MVLVAGLAAPLALAGPAVAADPASKYGDSLTALQSVLLFVVLPIVMLVLTALAVALPAALRRPRYRPSRGWDRGALWFGGPAGSTSVVEDAVRDAHVRPASTGGARGDW